MTDAELQGLTLQALNMAKKDIERKQFNFLLAIYHTGEGLHRMRRIEAHLSALAGEGWLNNGAAKDRVFGIIRMLVDAKPPNAFIFVTSSNMFLPTAKMRAMPLEEQKKLVDGGHDAHHEAVKQGLYTLTDCLSAVSQSPERVCLYTQPVASDGSFRDQPEVHFIDQDCFGGRLKMFGEETIL